MGTTFTKSMAWLHTWVGVVISALLFAIFWMGTLSVFDREIDRWMMPGTRLAANAPPVSLDKAAAAVAPLIPAHASQWRLDLPTPRVPLVRFAYRDGAGNTTTRYLDPADYTLIPDQGTLGGSGFVFPFHYSLHLKWMNLGEWLVGLAGMALLALLVSGVVIHKKIFTEFFTFRPRSRLPRSTLDLHHLMGVVGLPFYFTMALSGLIILFTIYFPLAHVGAYGGGNAAKAAFSAEAQGRYTRPKANAPGGLASLDAMAAQAEREWRGGRPYLVRVWHPSDANSYVELRRSFAHDITMNLDQLYFDAGSGALRHRFAAAPVVTVQRFIAGLHFIQFEHWTLRWLYFLAGLSGCVMIGTGLLFWVETRRAAHAKHGRAGVRVVEALTIGGVAGIVIATLAFFAANRLLPLGANFAGAGRAALEMWVFYLAWAACFIHAWARPAGAWRAQVRLIAILAPAVVLLNAVTTRDPLWRSVASGQWPVAGMDAMLLLLALFAVWVSRRLPQAAKPASDPRRVMAAERRS